MGYVEIDCQLCGVSFSIARIRRPEEEPSQAWTYHGSSYIDVSQHVPICGTGSGCTPLSHDGDGPDEHIAGPGCVATSGYSGYRIGVEEMAGCRSAIVILKKDQNWQEEPDDQDFEREGNFFLTGVGKHIPEPQSFPIPDLNPVRHGVRECTAYNIVSDSFDTMGVPMHPACFEVWKRASMERCGKVDLSDIWGWREMEGTYEAFDVRFPRHPAVKTGKEQQWHHEPGAEWLVANPVDIPGLNLLLNSCVQELEWRIYSWGSRQELLDIHRSVFWRPSDNGDSSQDSKDRKGDLFMKLPRELKYMILKDLDCRDIANLRLVTPAYRDLPVVLFRDILLKEYPWFWELKDLPIDKTMWFMLYKKIKFGFGDMMGLRNRRRIWKDVEEILRRVERYKEEGKIVDGEVV